MRLSRWLKVSLLTILAVVLSLALATGLVWLYFHPAYNQTRGIVYGQRQGRDLTLDLIRPARPNGHAVVLIVSGSWKSSPRSFRPWITAPLLRHGYTVFAVYHVPQPVATVMETAADVNRAVRFIRYHASEYGVDAARLGVTGGSAGGHLALLLATQGGPGPTDAPDPVDRESSAVQAVAIFFPVTDLLNLGDSTENAGDGGPPRHFVKAFGPNSTNLTVWRVIGRELSPIYYVSSNLPPTLICHGDADTLVPLDQSERFQLAARQAGGTVKLIVHRGGQHGWLTMPWDVRRFAGWFDQHLRNQSDLSWNTAATKLSPALDRFFQRHLDLGAYLTAPYSWNHQCIQPHPQRDPHYLNYGPLLAAMHGKKWVLQPRCVELHMKDAKVNLSVRH